MFHPSSPWPCICPPLNVQSLRSLRTFAYPERHFFKTSDPPKPQNIITNKVRNWWFVNLCDLTILDFIFEIPAASCPQNYATSRPVLPLNLCATHKATHEASGLTLECVFTAWFFLGRCNIVYPHKFLGSQKLLVSLKIVAVSKGGLWYKAAFRICEFRDTPRNCKF